MRYSCVNKSLRIFIYIFFGFILTISCKPDIKKYQKLEGNVFGTTFHIQYNDSLERDFNKEITNLFNELNNSLSTYHNNSLISKFNKGLIAIEVDVHFKNVFTLSKNIHHTTQGYFDPTIGKMVNVWGFGPNKTNIDPTEQEVDSLMQFVGFDKMMLDENKVIKENLNIVLDFNAIAKGYGVDVVGWFLEKQGIDDYLVEIGGEIRARGKNAKDNYWSVGIEEPNFDGSRGLTKITSLENESIATSGNYRKFRIDKTTGKKLAHTLNPKTGRPAQTDLLSVSVIAPYSCGDVDAYATAFMAMGFEKAKQIALQHADMKVFLIYLEDNKLKTFASSKLKLVE